MTLARVHLMCGRRAKVPQRKRRSRSGWRRRVLRDVLCRLRWQREFFLGLHRVTRACPMTSQETMVFLYAALRAVVLGELVHEVPEIDFCLDAAELLRLDPEDVRRRCRKLEHKGVFVNPRQQQTATQLELPLEGGGNG